MNCTFSFKKTNDSITIIISGDLIYSQVKKLQQNIDILNESLIYLDLTDVQSIDSFGLGMIVFYHTLLEKDKRKIIIIINNPESNVKKLLQQIHLDKVLNII
jgi:anti-anti-sigma factor